ALPEREIAEHRLPRQRIEIVALVEQGARVPEPLFHRDTRDPSNHRDLDGAAHLLDPAARGRGGGEGDRPDRLDPALCCRGGNRIEVSSNDRLHIPAGVPYGMHTLGGTDWVYVVLQAQIE